MLNRRTALTSAAAVAVSISIGAGRAYAAPADRWTPPSGDWRWAVARHHVSGQRKMSVRPLQDGLELWEFSPAGFMIVNARRPAVVECCEDHASPYDTQNGDLYYMGPGRYLSVGGGVARDLMNGQRFNHSGLPSFGRDVADMVHDRVTITASSPAPRIDTTSASGRVAPSYVSDVATSEIVRRVHACSYIIGCNVYPNTQGTCGWIAGSIVARYWCATRVRNILPTYYRTDKYFNLSPMHNFAEYLRNGMPYASWAPDLYTGLTRNAEIQGVPASCTWSLGQLGVLTALQNDRPAIVFGLLPSAWDAGYSAHAAVAYGTTSWGYICHYGYYGFSGVKLSSGLVGSNTVFWL